MPNIIYKYLRYFMHVRFAVNDMQLMTWKQCVQIFSYNDQIDRNDIDFSVLIVCLSAICQWHTQLAQMLGVYR